MSILTHSQNASQFTIASGQIGVGEDSAQGIGAEPPMTSATRAKGQSRRVKPESSPAADGNDTLVNPGATALAPATPAGSSRPKKISKQDAVLGLLRQTEGATIDELIEATAWQPHSVRGFLSGTVRKKRKLNLISDVVGNGVRRYRVVSTDQTIRNSEAGDQPTTDGSASGQGA